jgi:nucleoside-diphosphate-sugar epimerase
MLKTRMELPLRRLPRRDLDHVLQHAEPAWRALRGARLFVTGGTGFFGTWLLESIAAANAALDARITATVLSRSPGQFRARAPHLGGDAAFDWIAGDVRDFAFPRGSWSHAIHAAAPTVVAPGPESGRDLSDTIVRGTRRALDFAAERGANEFLFVSSGAVYGRQPSEVTHLAEDAPPASVQGSEIAVAYAEGKRAAEALCAAAAGRGLRPRIARGFAFVGPHLPLDAHLAAGNFLRDALRGGPVAVNGDGTPCRSYLHASDLVVWLVSILAKGEPLRPYNVGSDEIVTIDELAGRIARLPPRALPVRIQLERSGAAPERYVPSIDRARHELGLDVQIGLDGALRRTWEWLREGAP